MTGASQTKLMARLRRRSSRVVALLIAGDVVSGASLAVLRGVSTAAAGRTGTTAAPWTTSGQWGRSGQWGQSGQWGPNRSSGWGNAGAGRTWARAETRTASASSGATERFQVESTDPRGPGAIIVTGVINAGGIEHPGRAVDGAVFSGGRMRIDHSAGHPATRFNPTTCVGTITQTGPFRVYDATGRFSRLNGSGTYRFDAEYTTADSTSGCTKTITAYIETIDGTISVR
jgi:hypothetical protein